MADDPRDSALPDFDVEAVVQAMIADGVDITDQSAVHHWMVSHHTGLPADDDDEDFDPFEDAELDDVGLKEAFGLPDRLPPLRLPSDAELAAAARASGPLARARELALWVGDGRDVSEEAELTADGAAAAATALGVDAPDLTHLWDLACATEFVEIGATRATAGPAAAAWPSGEDDEEVLDVWATALAVALSSLALDGDLDGEEDLDFQGAGGAVLMMLFLARGEGVPIGELSEMVRESAIVDLRPVPATKRWSSWTAAHGDPATILLDRMADLGAVRHDGEVARLLLLGLWATWDQLLDADVEVPLLPPVAEMTAADLVTAADGLTDEELAAETAGWLATRSPEDAARELLDVAATGGPADRMYATSVASGIGAAAEPLWRKALDDPPLRPYAKIALTQLAGAEPPAFPPGLQPLPEDLAWLLTDVLAASADAFGPEEVEQELRNAVPTGQEQELFEVMWRLPHPDVSEVLTLLGAHHPDKTIAKAARKAAFKATSRGA